ASTPFIGMFDIAPNAVSPGSPKGLCFLPDVDTVPAAIRRTGGTMLLTLDDDNPGLQVCALDGSVVATEALTDNPVSVGTSLLNQGIDCGTRRLQLESCAFDPATGTLFLVNEGEFTDCSGFFILTPDTRCPSDFDGVNGVDGDDVIAFFGAWDAGDLAADFNGDGGVDGDDVIGFFGAWDAGC
ncbi:MAG: GC-type dockerin domain-anchored protein, partial [Phycisphaerales bacterium]